MMKLTTILRRASSSISPLCGAGAVKRISISQLTLISPINSSKLFSTTTTTTTTNNSAFEEDDFSELDSPVPEGRGPRLNLITEKPRESLKSNLFRKAASGIYLPGKDDPKLKSPPPKKSTHSPAIREFVENRTDVSRAKKDTEESPHHKMSNHKMSNSITIEKVPTTISLKHLKKAVSEFGEIFKASFRSDSDGFNSFDVEFKTRESKERAVASGKIIVKLCHLPIRTLYALESIAIRISNIGPDTAEPAIHSTCMLCGPVVGLSRTHEGSVDVIFGVKDFSGGEDILEKLNGLCADNKWSAQIHVGSDNKCAETPHAQHEAESELTNVLVDVQRQYQLKKVYIEDLVKLHQAVVHLQNRPTC